MMFVCCCCCFQLLLLVVDHLTVGIQLSLTYTYGIDLSTYNTDLMGMHLSSLIEMIAFICEFSLLEQSMI